MIARKCGVITMHSPKPWSAANGLALALACGALTACAVSTPATVTSAQQATSPVTNLAFVSQEAEESGIRARFKSALSKALSAQGVGMSADADYLADFTVSQRPGDYALQEVTSDDANASPPASDYKPRWFHKCKPARVNASLVIYAKTSGALHSKARGEFLACPGDTSQLEDLAKLLAARALQN